MNDPEIEKEISNVLSKDHKSNLKEGIIKLIPHLMEMIADYKISGKSKREIIIESIYHWHRVRNYSIDKESIGAVIDIVFLASKGIWKFSKSKCFKC